MRARRLWLIISWVTAVTSPVVGQERPRDDAALATLCMVEWSIGPVWAGERLGCPPVVQPLAALNRPCRTRYSTGVGTREEARLRYDAAGRLREVEHVGRGRVTYAYDAEGRLTTRTRLTTGYAPITTTYAYARGMISDETTSSTERHRWQVEGGRLVSAEYVNGAPDAPPMSVSQWIYERDRFVGVDAVLCRTPSRGGARCEPSGPVDRSRVTRDQAGRISRRTNGDTTDVYTYDPRGRVIRIRSASARFRDQMLVDYVCPDA